MFKLRQLLVCLLLSAILLCFGQDIFAQSTSFTSTLKEYRSSGWILSAGGAGFIGGNTSWSEELIDIDTLYMGTWTPESTLQWNLGLGRVWLIEDPILVDRINLNFIVGKRSMNETFDGTLDGVDTSLVGITNSVNLGLHTTIFHSFTISPDLFVEAGIGGAVRYDFFETGTEVINLDNVTTGVLTPQPITASLEAIIGVGAMMYRGRFVRVHVAADLLQLAPINGTGKTPWVQGDYRPYRIMLNFDLFRRKPAEGCASPNLSEKSRELFGKEMRGWRKAKNNWKKRRKSRRKRILG